MTKTYARLSCILSATLLFSVSCNKETGDGFAAVSLAIDGDASESKSILQNENKDSGFQVMIFNHSDASFVDCITFSSRSGGTLILRKNIAYDFYVIGNLWFLDGYGNKKTLEDAGFTTIEKVTGLAYRFGGTAVGGFNPETFADMAVYGIPYAGSRQNVCFSANSSVNVTAGYLFAKVKVTVDHSNMVNGGVAATVFQNSKLYVRGANSVVKPFATNVAASSASDLLEVSDYDAAMTTPSGAGVTYTYYVPENVQGTGNVSFASEKTPSVKPLATYVEFTAALDGAAATAGGYGGTLTYQFCLGANATTDFNVLRNTIYDVSLSFKTGSLFEPCWKIDGSSASDWSDTRKVCFASKPAVSSVSDLLREDGTQVLAVRQNRPAVCYVYFNRSGTPTFNERGDYLDYISSSPTSYNPENVSRSGLFIDYSPETLAQYGMELSYNQSTGEISVSYVSSSPNKGNFLNVPASGIPVTLMLYPGNAAGTGRSCTALIRTYGNLSLSRKESPDLYIGQKTVLEAEGFAGTPSLTASAGNVFRTTNVAGTDHYLGPAAVTMNSVGPGTYSLDLYSYRNNTSVTLTARSTDTFNDMDNGVDVSRTVTVYKPSLKLDRSSYFLPIDGTEAAVSAYYDDRSGNVMPESAFDPAVYSQLLKPVLAKGVQSTADFAKVTVDDAAGQVYLADLPSMVSTTQKTLGAIVVHGADAALFPNVSAMLTYRHPSVSGTPADILCNCSNTGSWPYMEASFNIDAAGCTTLPYGSGGEGIGDYIYPSENSMLDNKYSTLSVDGSTFKWSWGFDGNTDPYFFTVNLPYGKINISLRYHNKHSGNVYEMDVKSFTIRHQNIEFCALPVYMLGAGESNVFFCTRLSAFLYDWCLAHKCGNNDMPPVSFKSSLVFSSISYFRQSAEDYETHSGGGTGHWSYYDLNGSTWHDGVLLNASLVSWWMSGRQRTFVPDPGIVFTEHMLPYSQTDRIEYPTQAGFTVGAVSYQTLPANGYIGNLPSDKAKVMEYIPIVTANQIYPTILNSLVYNWEDFRNRFDY